MDTLEDSDFAKFGIRQTVYAVPFYVFFATRSYCLSLSPDLIELHRGLCAAYCTGFS